MDLTHGRRRFRRQIGTPPGQGAAFGVRDAPEEFDAAGCAIFGFVVVGTGQPQERGKIMFVLLGGSPFNYQIIELYFLSISGLFVNSIIRVVRFWGVLNYRIKRSLPIDSRSAIR